MEKKMDSIDYGLPAYVSEIVGYIESGMILASK
jgi:hypothetical protein